MTQKLCTVWMRNAILRNHPKLFSLPFYCTCVILYTESCDSACQKSRTLYISLLNVNQSLQNPDLWLGLKLKIFPLRWGFFFLFFIQLSNAPRLLGVGGGGWGFPVTGALQWCLSFKWKIHSQLSAMFTCRDGRGGELSSQASRMLYKPPRAVIFNSYSPKAKWILVNIPRDEVEGNIHQYSLRLRRITVN